MLTGLKTDTIQWNYNPLPKDEVSSLSESLNISNTLASLLVKRGINDPVKAQRFLYPRLAHLEDPFNLTNMEAAISRLLKAIHNNESITILGDYDVDGVTSTALLTDTLRYLGLKPHYLIPRRAEEGYGFSQEVIDRALEDSKPSLFIGLDCGTNSTDEINYLVKKGIDVLIIDHHQSKHTPPKNAILINPHVFEKTQKPWSNLCTVGLVFKLIHALFKSLRDESHPKAEDFSLKELLDLVALGTVADMVPLLEENRVLTYFGLHKIQHNNRPGLQALCRTSGLTEGQPVRPSDVSFRLGPRINASGRLSDATLPVDMLLGTDFSSCFNAAQNLHELNRERQEIEREVTEDVENYIHTHNLHENLALVIYSPEWHSGVIGIVAGKISRTLNRPTIVLAKEGKLAKGSGRSISGINLVEALESCSHLLESWGGHPMAAGVALSIDNVEAFQQAFNEAIYNQVQGEIPAPSITIAHYLNPEDLTESLLEELELLHPFGIQNPEPIFGIQNAIIPSPPKPFSNNHLRFQIKKPTGLPLNGIAWKMADNPPPYLTPVNLAVKFSYNYWNGRKSPQIELIDWQLPAFLLPDVAAHSPRISA